MTASSVASGSSPALAAARLRLLVARGERSQRHLERAQVYRGVLRSPTRRCSSCRRRSSSTPRTRRRTSGSPSCSRTDEQFDDALFYFEEAHRLDPEARRCGARSRVACSASREPDRAERADRGGSRPQSRLRRGARAAFGRAAGARGSERRAGVRSHRRRARPEEHARRAPGGDGAQGRDRRAPQKQEPATTRSSSRRRTRPSRTPSSSPRTSRTGWCAAAIERARLLVSLARLRAGADRRSTRTPSRSLKDLPDARAPDRGGVGRACARGPRTTSSCIWALSRLRRGRSVRATRAGSSSPTSHTKRGEDGIAVLERMVKERPDDAQGAHHLRRAPLEHGQARRGGGASGEGAARQPSAGGDARGAGAAPPGGGRRRRRAGPLARLRSEFPDSGQTDQAEASLANAEGRSPTPSSRSSAGPARGDRERLRHAGATRRLRAGNPRAALDAVDRALSLKQRAAPRLCSACAAASWCASASIARRSRPSRALARRVGRFRSSSCPTSPGLLRASASPTRRARRSSVRSRRRVAAAARLCCSIAREESEARSEGRARRARAGRRALPGHARSSSGCSIELPIFATASPRRRSSVRARRPSACRIRPRPRCSRQTLVSPIAQRRGREAGRAGAGSAGPASPASPSSTST